MDSVWLKVKNLHVHINGKEILRDISLEIKAREQWAIFGEAGAGKTVFAQVLSGRHAFQGNIIFPEKQESQLTNQVYMVDQYHRFRDLQNQTNFYYQQRYNSIDSGATITVEEDLAVFGENKNGLLSKTALLESFHLTALLNEPLIQLSNGENKRLQILKAVLHFPALLILDEPYTGLDADGRLLLDGVLNSLSDSGQSLMLLSSRDHIPDCFNRYANLQSGKLILMGSRKEVHLKQMIGNRPSIGVFPSAISFEYPEFQYAVRMQQVYVRYEGKTILAGIDWEVERGSRWALSGPNGAGKSTLLSLITGDNPQAYANEIFLFDRKRGSGESIWEIKRKTGFLSPELQLYFDPSATAFTALASGLFDTIGLFRQLAPEQVKLVTEWLRFLDCEKYGNRQLTSLPAGIRRLILLGRALIKTPPLLILDEPCQALDQAQTAFTLELISRYCDVYGATLIFVSHYAEDYPPGIQRMLCLENGKIV